MCGATESLGEASDALCGATESRGRARWRASRGAPAGGPDVRADSEATAGGVSEGGEESLRASASLRWAAEEPGTLLGGTDSRATGVFLGATLEDAFALGNAVEVGRGTLSLGGKARPRNPGTTLLVAGCPDAMGRGRIGAEAVTLVRLGAVPLLEGAFSRVAGVGGRLVRGDAGLRLEGAFWGDGAAIAAAGDPFPGAAWFPIADSERAVGGPESASSSCFGAAVSATTGCGSGATDTLPSHCASASAGCEAAGTDAGASAGCEGGGTEARSSAGGFSESSGGSVDGAGGGTDRTMGTSRPASVPSMRICAPHPLHVTLTTRPRIFLS